MMASASMKSMYKGKVKESNSTSTRRRSKGLERKKNRDDEVNKRRFISDDMSPLVEDNDDQMGSLQGKPVPHQKATTRQERLKQWREERKRKMEEEKKNTKKPQFKVSGVHYSGEVDLYSWTKTKEVKTGPLNPQAKAAKSSIPAKTLEPMKPVPVNKNSRTATSLNTKTNTLPGGSTKATRSSTRAATAPKNKTAQSGTIVPTKVNPAPATLPEQPVTRNTRSKRTGTNLYTKLTASAAAKAKTDKPKEFLRAKSRTAAKTSRPVTKGEQVDTENVKVKKESNKKLIEIVETEQEGYEDVEKETVREPEEEDCGSSSDSKELHLSDSAVSTPKHSTPAVKKRSSGKAKLDSEQMIPAETSDTESENVRASGSKPTGRQRRSRAASRKSGRNLSVIQVSDVQAAMKMVTFEPNWVNAFAPVAENNADSEEGSENAREVFVFKGNSSEEEMSDDLKGSIERKSLRSSSITAENQDSPIKAPCNDNIDDENAENDPLETSNKENVADKEIGLRDKILRKSASKHRKSLSQSSGSKRMDARVVVSEGQDKQNENEIEQRDTPVESAKKSRKRSVSSVSRRHSRRLVFATDDEIGESVPSPAKRSRQSTVQLGMVDDDEEENFVQREKDVDDTQTMEVEPATPVSQQRIRMGSAMAKRRSVRIAALVTSSTEETASIESEAELARKTPRSKRKSLRTRRSSTARQRRQSTIVSVSDEGTTDVEGEDVVGNIRTTPRTDQSKLAVSSPSHGKLNNLRRSMRRSEVIDVSDEGTALVEEQDPTSSIVYHVTKPAETETLTRVLQELDVQKVDGEASFIENSLVCSTPRSTGSKKEELEQSSPPTALVEDLPVTATPRSSRQRGQSMVPSAFKTPGQPPSALRSRSVKRRKTEHSSPSKSPEEMIEILKKSPMIEMTRRRSRLAASPAPALMSINFEAMLTDSALEQATSGSPIQALSKDTEASPEPAGVESLEAATVSSLDSTKKNSLSPEVAERVQYFRDLLVSETRRLNEQCNKWNEISSVTPGLGEEVLGQIRSTVGKAQLLMDQRFKQFSGLVDNCEFGLGEKETTPTDLQGFWEMIYFQVEDVDQLFAELSKLQGNNWQVKMPSPEKKILKTKKMAVKVSKPKVKSNFAAFREELMKRKAQAKAKTPVKACTEAEPETTKVFDAGFFRVTSPVRTPTGKRLSNTPSKQAAPEEASSVHKNAEEKVPETTSRPATSVDSRPSTPAGLGNKENEIKSTPNNSRLMSMSAKRLSYVPVIPSPLLNDITGIMPKKL